MIYLKPKFWNNTTNAKKIVEQFIAGKDFEITAVDNFPYSNQTINLQDILDNEFFQRQEKEITIRYSKNTKKIVIAISEASAKQKRLIAQKKKMSEQNKVLSFDAWLMDVDHLLSEKLCGLGLNDLSDVYEPRDAFDNGLSPAEFIEENFSGDCEEILIGDIFGL